MEAIQITALNREVANAIVTDGEYYFTSNKMMDCFNLENDKKKKIKAIDSMLTFNKWLNKLKCEFFKVGFVVENMEELQKAKVDPLHRIRLAFTYQIQSKRYKNDPIKIDRWFNLEFPVLALPNLMADMWLEAYQEVPEIDIIRMSNGID